MSTMRMDTHPDPICRYCERKLAGPVRLAYTGTASVLLTIRCPRCCGDNTLVFGGLDPWRLVASGEPTG